MYYYTHDDKLFILGRVSELRCHPNKDAENMQFLAYLYPSYLILKRRRRRKKKKKRNSATEARLTDASKR